MKAGAFASGRMHGTPKISVIVPARDEEASIGACLRSILSSDYPDFEVIAVNDRSDDTTGQIMRRIAAEDARLRVVDIAGLPDDWLGKPHAMQTAAELADGEYLLFTDGDVIFHPELISRTAGFAAETETDHLSLLPKQIPGLFMENALFAYFAMMGLIALQPNRIRTASKRSAAGIGAFNMVRRTAFDAVGGFHAVKYDPVDDYKLGLLLKRAGFRQRLLTAEGLLTVQWFSGVSGFVRVTEKNFFAAMRYSLPLSLLAGGLQFLSHAIPYAGLVFAQGASVSGYLAAAITMHGLLAYIGIRGGAGWKVTLLLPVSAGIMAFSLFRSAYKTLRQKGIFWRGRFYPLEKLRKGLVR
ncbi:glycosyltransferase [candidate division KSB1 bacterium]